MRAEGRYIRRKWRVKCIIQFISAFQPISLIKNLTCTSYLPSHDMYGDRKTENFTDYYMLVDHIGSGGYGTVWTCIDRDTKQMCAVKIVPDKKCLRKTWCPRFNKYVPDEVALWLPLYHPNLVALLEVFYDEDGNYWMYVMDYEKEYKDLFTYIDKNGPLTSAAAGFITRQVIKVSYFYLFPLSATSLKKSPCPLITL